MADSFTASPPAVRPCNCVEDIRHVLERLTVEVHELAEHSARTRLATNSLTESTAALKTTTETLGQQVRTINSTVARLCARTAPAPVTFALPG